MKTGRVGSFTLALAIVILAIFSLRVLLIPEVSQPESITSQLERAVTPVTQIPDFSGINDITEKKKAFFDFLRPIIQQQNAIIEEERNLISDALTELENGGTLSSSQLTQLNMLCDKYQYAARNIDIKSLNSLLKRVDIVPESMVLIQAANESGWGVHVLHAKDLTFLGNGVFQQVAA